jgi:hypothetical protein
MFSINATIVNNSNNDISLHNGCGGSFLVVFDSHAKLVVKKICNWMALQIILKPGESFNATSLVSNLVYKAISTGSANTTVTISYNTQNQSSLPSAVTTISKSVSFTVLNISEAGNEKMFPLKQLQSKISPKDVLCNDGLQLVFKACDGSPKCVKSSSVDKLVLWGWAKMTSDGIVPRQEPSIKTISLEDNANQSLFTG